MRRWLLGLVLLLGLPLAAQTTNPVSGYCDLGGSKAQVSGLGSMNYQQGNIPGCTITVYLHGTQTLATIYADDNNTPLSNPFTAVVPPSPNAGFYIFWAATGQTYDVVGSGGIAPNTYPSPQTIKEVALSVGGGGGSTPCGVLYDIQINDPLGTFGCDSGHWFENPTTHTAQLGTSADGGTFNVLGPSDGTVNVVGTNAQSTVGSGYLVLKTATNPVPSPGAIGVGFLSPSGGTPDAYIIPPTAVGTVGQALGITGVSGDVATTGWITPASSGQISQEFMYPVFSTNAPSPTTTNDLVDTLYQQGQSQFFAGPGPANIPSNYVVQAVTCGENSTGVFTCPMPAPVTPGNRLCALATTQCGLACFNSFTFTDSLANVFSRLDDLTWTHTPSSDACAPVTVGGQDTITITPSFITTGTTQAQIVELQGTTSIDAHAAGDSASFTAGVVANLTPVTSTINNDFVLSWQTSQQTGSGAATFGAGIGGTLVNQANQANTTSIMSQGYIAGAAGVFTPTAYSNISGGGVGGPGSTWPSFTIAFGATAPPTEATPTWHSIWPYDILDSMMTGTDVGVADAYNISFSHCPTALTALKSWAWFTPANANATTTPTLLWCGLGPHTITKNGQSALVANDLITTKVAYLLWDGTDWELQNPAGVSAAGVSFATITGGTNTVPAAMVVGTGSSLAPSSATVGVVSANQINGTSLAGLATGILKNTTTTGVPSIATSADTIAQFTGCSGTQYLGADGACHTVTAGGSPVYKDEALNYTVLASDFSTPAPGCGVIHPTATITVTLVASGSQPAAGQCITIPMNVDNINVTIAPSGQTLFVNGASSSGFKLYTGMYAWIVSNGTNYIMSYSNIAQGSNHSFVISDNGGFNGSNYGITWIGGLSPSNMSGVSDFNTVVGAQAGGSSMGQGNTIMGRTTGSGMSGGSFNTAIGYAIGPNNFGGNSASQFNLILGYNNTFATVDTPSTTTANYVNIANWLTGDNSKGLATLVGPVPTVATNDCGSTSQGTVTAGSTNTAGEVTAGTATVTSCAISFTATRAAAPWCVCSSEDNTVAAAGLACSASTTKLTATSAGNLDSKKWTYICFAGSNVKNPAQ